MPLTEQDVSDSVDQFIADGNYDLACDLIRDLYDPEERRQLFDRVKEAEAAAQASRPQ